MSRRPKTHPLDGVGPGTAKQVRCLACRKVVMVGEFRDELLPPTVQHYDRFHGPLKSGMFLEGPGGHFQIEPVPPARCDLCSAAAERPWWEWTTPWSPDYQVQDPEWLVCDGCHSLVVAHATVQLCQRIFEVSNAEFVWDDIAKRREDIAYVVTRFLSHVDPSATRRIEV